MKIVVDALSNLSAVLRSELTLLAQHKPTFAAALRDADSAIAHANAKQLPRVLITVSGGVASFVADEGVAVEVFDWDNSREDPDGAEGVPAVFADLAVPLGIPLKDCPAGSTLPPAPDIDDSVYVLVQEGGSSSELYLHGWPTAGEAEEDRTNCCRDGRYRTSPVIQVQQALARHPGFYDAVEQILSVSRDLSFPDVPHSVPE